MAFDLSNLDLGGFGQYAQTGAEIYDAYERARGVGHHKPKKVAQPLVRAPGQIPTSDDVPKSRTILGMSPMTFGFVIGGVLLVGGLWYFKRRR